MELIQDMPLIQQVLTAAALVTAIVLIVVARRKRSDEDVAVASDHAPSRRGRAKKADTSLPRRKRRKLAAEAAHSMGMTAGAATAQPEIAVPPVEVVAVPSSAPAPEADVAVAESDVAVAAAPVVVVEHIATAHSDDPYVSDDGEAEFSAAVDEPPAAPPVVFDAVVPAAATGVVVADPGWPSPGELAASFDPDVFDPLPEVHHDTAAEYVEEDVASDQPTGVIEMPDMNDALESSEALAQTADQWADDFDPAVGWADDDPGAFPAVEVEVDEAEEDWSLEIEDAPAAAVAESPVDMEQFWGDPDEDWADPADAAVAIEQVAVPDVAEAHARDGIDLPEVEWPDEAAAWEPAAEAGIPPGPAGSDDTSVSGNEWPILGGQTGPVVLDLAALAASGQPLELVIEPNGEGNGVRLRIGAPGTPLPTPDARAAFPDAAAETSASWTGDTGETPLTEAAVVDEEAADASVVDVPFLTGGPSAAEEPGIAAPAVLPKPPGVEESHIPPVDLADEMPTPDDLLDPFGASEVSPEPVDEPDADPEDDPARILADIRARLADLDARRHSRA